MKEFDQETFENMLSSKGVRIADYVHKTEEHDEDLLLRPLEVNDHTKGIFILTLVIFLRSTFITLHYLHAQIVCSLSTSNKVYA